MSVRLLSPSIVLIDISLVMSFVLPKAAWLWSEDISQLNRCNYILWFQYNISWCLLITATKALCLLLNVVIYFWASHLLCKIFHVIPWNPFTTAVNNTIPLYYYIYFNCHHLISIFLLKVFTLKVFSKLLWYQYTFKFFKWH